MIITIVYSTIILAITILHSWILIRKRLYRELAVFGLLMIPGTIFGYLAAHLTMIEDPLFFLKWIYRPFNDLFSTFFPS
ncbi:hypothetical protein [Paenibacillus sp. 598K]|uniref:hypothetical protein n=1 Tax=Paenibacillus sp. 598K TaxID=1117987 RepID=UPI000FFEF399|nr:hypothetical protein [Paenibacillus sp. 598K]